MHDYCTSATTADALKRLAVLHYINTCVNVTLYHHRPTYRYKALQKYLRCLIHALFINLDIGKSLFLVNVLILYIFFVK